MHHIQPFQFKSKQPHVSKLTVTFTSSFRLLQPWILSWCIHELLIQMTSNSSKKNPNCSILSCVLGSCSFFALYVLMMTTELPPFNFSSQPLFVGALWNYWTSAVETYCCSNFLFMEHAWSPATGCRQPIFNLFFPFVTGLCDGIYL